MNSRNQLLHRDVTLTDQCRVQTGLRSIVIRIVVAEGCAVSAPVLIVALIGRDEREIRHFARL